MTTNLQAVAITKPCHLIPGRVKWPEPYHQHACESQYASQKEELGSFRPPVNSADQRLNSWTGARAARMSVAWFVL